MSGPELAAKAQQLRGEADLVKLVAGTIRDAVNLDDASDRLVAVAVAKATAAEQLDEMAREQS
jgi:hypothetical protein